MDTSGLGDSEGPWAEGCSAREDLRAEGVVKAEGGALSNISKEQSTQQIG